MFYEPGKTDHNLPHDPFKACVIPRPIGWISTISPEPSNLDDGAQNGDHKPSHNLAPYSQFNNLTFDPPYVMFSANQAPNMQQKDTVRNAEATGYFCWQLATYKLREAVNISAEQVPYGTDEFERAGLEKTYSTILPIQIPMVKASPVRFECQYHSTLKLPGNPPMGTVDVVIGKVIGIHVDDSVLTPDGKIDVSKTEPIARCGYYDYAVVRETFEMVVPGGSKALSYGMEGSVRMHKAAREKGKTSTATATREEEKVAAEKMGVEGKDGQGPP